MNGPTFVAALLVSRLAIADPTPDPTPAKRTPDTSLADILRGPFQSSRLFSMPVADVVGAYMMSLSADGSLLQQPGLLTSAGVLAIGFGDIAQLEYRHTAAISVTGVQAPLPAVGVQLKVPIPEHSGVPAFGVAFRLGVPRMETFGNTTVTEKSTDFYLVGRLRFDSFKWLTLHGGARVSQTQLTLGGDQMGSEKKNLILPTAGYEIQMNPAAKIIGEVALAPQFNWMQGTSTAGIGYGLLGRFGLRWAIVPSVIIDGSIGYQLEVADAMPASGFAAVTQWDIRLGAEVFIPWGALACRTVGAFCD